MKFRNTLLCASLPLLIGLSGLPGLQIGCGEDPGEYDIEKVSLIGILSEQAVPVCNGSQDYSWVDSHLEVGFIRIDPTTQLPKNLIGQPVLVTGWKNPVDPPQPPQTTGACPPIAQMRSDWVLSRNGFRIKRQVSDGVRETGPMAAESVKPFDGLRLKRQGQELKAELVNTLGIPLQGIELLAHYEGCQGKPGSQVLRHAFAWLQPGASASASFPGHLQRHEDPRHHYALHSIQVINSHNNVLFDFDQVLSDPALHFSCD